ncbi:MAG: heavy metal translocating P-type ATPase [Acidobacteria bacterium]|nr:heavy metal translocating P-type ATPase [Acidobacteriota bacterium]
MSPSPPRPASSLRDVRLRVPAMDCADEVALVRSAVETDEGVVAVAFDLVHARVDLTIDPALTSETKLREAIAKTGLTVEAMPVADATVTPAPRARARMTDVLLGGGLFFAGWIVDGAAADSWSEALFGHADASALAHAHAPGAVPLYAAAVVVGLWRMWPRALAALRLLRLDMHVLVCVSAAGAAAIGQWAEAAAVAFLFAVAHRLEAWSLERARDALATVARRGVVSAESSQQSAPVERWIERFATIYTPAVTLAAIVVAVVPPLLDGQWAGWFYRALVFLVMACPCALVISTPVTVVAAVTALATRGVVVKGGAPLERAAATTHHTRDAFDAVGVRIASDDDDADTLDAADVVIVAGAPDAETLGLLGRQAAHAVAVIRQNVGISLVTKLAFLVSALLGSAPLWLAVVADTGATVAVTLNGLRLLRLRR